MESTNQLRVIFAADAAGYSRLVASDPNATLEALEQARDVFRSRVSAADGRVVDTAGDSVLAALSSATGAVEAAMRVQQDLAQQNVDKPTDRWLQFRIGIHLGDVIERPDGSVYGDGVNVAARLQAIAPPGCVVISDAVHSAARADIASAFKDAGEHELKNIARPVRAFWFGNAAGELLPIQSSHAVRGFGGRPAIAVLPFENLGGNADDAYFADGLSEDLLTRLAMWRWMPVIGRNSSFAYRGGATDLKRIGSELGARYIVQGSVRRAANRVRVSAQMSDLETGHQVWANRFDRVLNDIFALQDEIAGEVAAALEPAVGRAERRRASLRPPQNLNAWDIYQRASWHFSRFTRESLDEAFALAMRSAALDAGFSSPLAGAACCRLLQAQFLYAADTDEAMRAAHELSTQALEREPDDPFAHTVMSQVRSVLGHHEAALQHARRALEVNPSYAPAYFALGVASVFDGHHDDAVRAVQTACRLSPNDPMFEPGALATLSLAHCMRAEYEAAREVAALAIDKAPGYPTGYRAMASALGHLGRIEEGRQHLATYLRMLPGYSMSVARRLMPFRDPAEFERFMSGFQKLGWAG